MGDNWVCSKDEGKQPVWRYRLMISVRAGNSMDRLALKRSAGMGSSRHDLMSDFLMRSPFLRQVMSDNEDFARSSEKRSRMVELAGRGREERSALTFLTKKLEKSRARTSRCA